jgi:hypothetical protein
LQSSEVVFVYGADTESPKYHFQHYRTDLYPSPRVHFRGPGQEVWRLAGGSPIAGRELAEPVQDGASWDWAEPPYAYLHWWEYVGTVTVPAGTFAECWAVRTANYDSVYCPGVGLAAETIQTSDATGAPTGNGCSAELVSTNFDFR